MSRASSPILIQQYLRAGGVRMPKVKQKVSGRFSTQCGLQTFYTIRSGLASRSMQGDNRFQQLSLASLDYPSVARGS